MKSGIHSGRGGLGKFSAGGWSGGSNPSTNGKNVMFGSDTN